MVGGHLTVDINCVFLRRFHTACYLLLMLRSSASILTTAQLALHDLAIGSALLIVMLHPIMLAATKPDSLFFSGRALWGE